MPLDALVSLVMTFNEGIMLERAQGITTGHRELLAWIDGWLEERGGVTTLVEARAEQSRARYPDEEGYVERDGVRVFYEVYGQGEPTLLFLPTWTIIHSRHWKMQLPYFARHARAITFDPRGNGRSDRPPEPEAYAEAEFAARRARRPGRDRHRAGRARGALTRAPQRALLLAAEHPDRVAGTVFIGPALPLGPIEDRTVSGGFDDELDDRRGLGEVQPPLLAPRLPGLPGVLLLAVLLRAALDEADRGLRRLGPRDRRRRPCF